MASPVRLGIAFLAGGVAGWLLENLLTGAPRYSRAFSGAKVPFLPVYGAGAAAIVGVGPALERAGVPWFLRTAVYGGTATAVEWVACQFDRAGNRTPSWGYGPNLDCVDAPHAIAWSLMGIGVEQLNDRL